MAVLTVIEPPKDWPAVGAKTIANWQLSPAPSEVPHVLPARVKPDGTERDRPVAAALPRLVTTWTSLVDELPTKTLPKDQVDGATAPSLAIRL